MGSHAMTIIGDAYYGSINTASQFTTTTALPTWQQWQGVCQTVPLSGLGGLTQLFPYSTLNQIVYTPQEKKEIMARLIHYVVVDSDPVLIERSPQSCIVAEGFQVTKDDDKAFIMELGSKFNLETHNLVRTGIEYEDDEGRTKKLRPIRMGHLDVHIQTIKEYLKK